jgi:hypothetical protein
MEIHPLMMYYFIEDVSTAYFTLALQCTHCNYVSNCRQRKNLQKNLNSNNHFTPREFSLT